MTWRPRQRAQQLQWAQEPGGSRSGGTNGSEGHTEVAADALSSRDAQEPPSWSPRTLADVFSSVQIMYRSVIAAAFVPHPRTLSSVLWENGGEGRTKCAS